METIILYKLTHIGSLMSYIGQTANLSRRLWEHQSSCYRYGTPLALAIRQLGVAGLYSGFTCVEVACCRNRRDANATEIVLIEQEQTRYPNGFNVHRGGERLMDEAIRTAAISKKLTGRKHAPDRRHNSKPNSTSFKDGHEAKANAGSFKPGNPGPWLGKKRSPETIAKIRATLLAKRRSGA